MRHIVSSILILIGFIIGISSIINPFYIFNIDFISIIIIATLGFYVFFYNKILEKHISPISLILISAFLGSVLY